MLKALIWKEWREQRSLVLAGVLVAVLLPLGVRLLFPGNRAPVGAELALTVDAMLLWIFVLPAFAAAMGATATVADRLDGTRGFLLSRPVSRSLLFAVKLGVGALGFTLLVLTAGLGPRFVLLVTGPDVSDLLMPRFANPFPAYGPEILAGTGIVALILLALSLSALAGLQARTALTAAALGGGTAFAVMLGLQSVWKLLGEPTQGVFLSVTVGPVVAVTLVLGARRFAHVAGLDGPAGSSGASGRLAGWRES